MSKNRYIGEYPVIGIRPIVDGRRGPQMMREKLEPTVWAMAHAAKKLFELLISVQGVGPKAAMAILSLAPAEEVRNAIANADAAYVSKASGVGKKSAARLALYALNMSESEADKFVDSIKNAREQIHSCPVCQNFTDKEICPVCTGENRDKTVICVVESPKDVMVIEKTRDYSGLYHVLHGVISPLNNIGPDQLKINELLVRVKSGDIKEVIMATNPSVEGETTASYISRLIKPLGIKVSRLAYGIPVNGTLEYTDAVTLSRALEGRKEM